MQNYRLIQGYLQRTIQYVGKQTKEAFRMQPKDYSEQQLFEFDSIAKMEDWVVGSDSDIGGFSQAYWGLTPENNALFWGTISTRVPPGLGLHRSGYAGIRSKEKGIVLFHRERIDTSMYRYLEIHAKGDTKQWMVNIATENLFPSIIWQHRLNFRRPGEWETIRIPFRDFVRTSHGYFLLTRFVQKKQINMDRTKIKSIGFSILGQPGDFSLELKSIKAMNTRQTFGDFDVLEPDEYLDHNGDIKK